MDYKIGDIVTLQTYGQGKIMELRNNIIVIKLEYAIGYFHRNSVTFLDHDVYNWNELRKSLDEIR